MTDLFAAEDMVNRLLQGDRLVDGRSSAFMDTGQLVRKETNGSSAEVRRLPHEPPRTCGNRRSKKKGQQRTVDLWELVADG